MAKFALDFNLRNENDNNFKEYDFGDIKDLIANYIKKISLIRKKNLLKILKV